ncbi:adenylosuccinate synthase [Phycisphaera mikurensis]|uniref:Adenylosuccinate synthetase n=1 Tax=Phycisphaera mikurensis (strain NBRC 102666 / KCTC 22515 / FYK2301M01) TaxID=1142394 RepID=I0IAH2_PHYMF|nr:adenylosuccinate synthase [Phycisphaera mikurensis]MBB6441743.1 adenylosuccinate synthase [Phycisphaera mikurensis]BAM02260.1 adenylosuccinate synthetase [Phycisphaera mikurensis NBRC 102666]
MSANAPTAPEAAAPADRPLPAGNAAVVGLQWGDEGKGKVVDLLAGSYDAVVRYNGGANAGHSVEVGDRRYALHLIPSGILHGRAVNVLGNGVVIDPEKLLGEVAGLREAGLTVTPKNLKISDRAHLVLPWHKAQDRLQEAAMQSVGRAIGTTGRGIGPAYADKALRAPAVRAGELLDVDTLAEKLHAIGPMKEATLAGLAALAGVEHEPVDVGVLVDWLRPLAEALAPHLCDASFLLHEKMDAGEEVLFEGANATLLDVDHGTFPYITSSNCSSLGLHPGAGVAGHRVPHVLGVVKAYQTRVGGGPFPTELLDATGDRIREVGREYGTTTGRPRRVGWLDLAALRYSVRLTGTTGLAVMLLDVLAGLPELRVCTGYVDRASGAEVRGYPADADALGRVEPVLKTLPGFGEDVTGCRSMAELPAAARGYLAFISEAVGVPVTLASVGPRRDQTIFA